MPSGNVGGWRAESPKLCNIEWLARKEPARDSDAERNLHPYRRSGLGDRRDGRGAVEVAWISSTMREVLRDRSESSPPAVPEPALRTSGTCRFEILIERVAGVRPLLHQAQPRRRNLMIFDVWDLEHGGRAEA
jgi:hypothetical protein